MRGNFNETSNKWIFWLFLNLIRSLNFRDSELKYILFFEYLNCGFFIVFSVFVF
ncbi:hypothetical protein LEP1GSC188_4274 [Leptospira weilii serovar Topaz str. LT2116]|uniref:Uncharacterized protein n=1 Tax=Leptospira weilii serovar Topaz str. LT2116 TaxID=1088540 RepID=M3ESN4_9LEPT|nr:hypothetical protein LEP1GSC188_4274 [Leptospira weilii serovar Topaz str. LT2116]